MENKDIEAKEKSIKIKLAVIFSFLLFGFFYCFSAIKIPAVANLKVTEDIYLKLPFSKFPWIIINYLIGCVFFIACKVILENIHQWKKISDDIRNNFEKGIKDERSHLANFSMLCILGGAIISVCLLDNESLYPAIIIALAIGFAFPCAFSMIDTKIGQDLAMSVSGGLGFGLGCAIYNPIFAIVVTIVTCLFFSTPFFIRYLFVKSIKAWATYLVRKDKS